MDIGGKIKNARADCGLTQERAAELLGVSRQTISNWETGKTYPDIVSVVRMSDIYAVSLDRLLKEDAPVSDYLSYLDESTNTVKSHGRLSMSVILSVYLGIWAVSLIVFWFFIDGSYAFGYSLMFLWILLPVATFVVSLLIGKTAAGRSKWFFPPAFGFMYMLAEYATFKTANMVSGGGLRLPKPVLLLAGFVISLAAVAIGALAARFAARRRS